MIDEEAAQDRILNTAEVRIIDPQDEFAMS